jgi:hypothetical protein
MKLQNGDIFLSKYTLGKGKFYISSAGLTDVFSNFARHAVFVPTMYKIAMYSQPGQSLFYSIGRHDLVEFEKMTGNENVFHIKNSKGDFDIIPEYSVINLTPMISVHNQISEANNYNLYSGKDVIKGFSFNFDRKESDLTNYNPDELKIKLEDFNESWAQLGWYQWWNLKFDVNIKNFVFDSHFSWESASNISDDSGCGIVFALQEDDKNYSVFLDKTRIYFTRSDRNYYYELGKTSGTGRVQFGNPAEADFSLIVFETQAYVFVDKNFIGEYSLSTDQPLKGRLAYSLLSGTNKDYGTRCKITNSKLWVLNP